MSTEVEQVQNAIVQFDAVAAGLQQLQKTFGGVLFDVETPSGMEMAKAARTTLREPRYRIEQIRKDAKKPLLEIGRKLDSEAKRITTAILALEDPIDQQIKQEEERKEREKLAKIEAEQLRIATIQARIDAIRQLPVKASGRTAEHARSILAEAQAIQVDATFAEFTTTASDALTAAIAGCRGVVLEREAYEAEQAKIAAERAELALLRAEHEARDRQAREANEAALKAQQAEIDRQRAEQTAAATAERERLAQEFAEVEAQKAEMEQAREEERRRKETAERERTEQVRVAAIKRPSDAELISVIAQHYSVPRSKVLEWLPVLRDKAA